MEDTVRHILKSGVEMASRDPSRPVCNLPLTDKPTSRLQTRMLAAWFGTQIATLAEHGELTFACLILRIPLLLIPLCYFLYAHLRDFGSAVPHSGTRS